MSLDKYIIVEYTELSTLSLEFQVNKHLKQGYELAGGVSAVFDGKRTTLYQALIYPTAKDTNVCVR